MLRRKPTALTISSEDIAAFEESHARRLAYQHFLKIGEDPHGYFRHGAGASLLPSDVEYIEQQQRQRANAADESLQGSANAGGIDPNDELKPLPGDKARIVRSREERIVGASSGGGGGGVAGAAVAGR